MKSKVMSHTLNTKDVHIMCIIMKKPDLVCDQAIHNPACSATETSYSTELLYEASLTISVYSKE